MLILRPAEVSAAPGGATLVCCSLRCLARKREAGRVKHWYNYSDLLQAVIQTPPPSPQHFDPSEQGAKQPNLLPLHSPPRGVMKRHSRRWKEQFKRRPIDSYSNRKMEGRGKKTARITADIRGSVSCFFCPTGLCAIRARPPRASSRSQFAQHAAI